VIAIDASVWVSAIVQQDVHHASSQAWLDDYIAIGGAMFCPELLLQEVAGAISRRTGQSAFARRAAQDLENLTGMRLIPMDRTLRRRAWELAADLGLRGTDATYVAVAQLLRVPLLTLDRDQHTRGGRVITTHAPMSIDPRAV
jgi:predicted nucleic acid-binding protein